MSKDLQQTRKGWASGGRKDPGSQIEAASIVRQTCMYEVTSFDARMETGFGLAARVL
jgi:hypothetical protein